MKKHIFSIVYSTAVLMILIMSSASYGLSDEEAEPAESHTNGARIWMNTCAQCHNARDTNDITPDKHRLVMAHMKLRAQLTDREYKEVLGFLVGNQDEEDTASVETEEGTENGATKVSNKATSGKKLYKQSCIACHGANGSGNKIPGVPNFTNKKTSPLVKKSRDTLVKSVEKGTSKMPPKGGNASLTHKQIESIVDYMIEKF